MCRCGAVQCWVWAVGKQWKAQQGKEGKARQGKARLRALLFAYLTGWHGLLLLAWPGLAFSAVQRVPALQREFGLAKRPYRAPRVRNLAVFISDLLLPELAN